jgi:hypothetical protein
MSFLWQNNQHASVVRAAVSVGLEHHHKRIFQGDSRRSLAFLAPAIETVLEQIRELASRD